MCVVGFFRRLKSTVTSVAVDVTEIKLMTKKDVVKIKLMMTKDVVKIKLMMNKNVVEVKLMMKKDVTVIKLLCIMVEIFASCPFHFASV